MTSVSNVTIHFPIVVDFLLSIAKSFQIDTLNISFFLEIPIAFANKKLRFLLFRYLQNILKILWCVSFNC